MNEFTVYDVHKGHCVNTNQQLLWNMNVRLQKIIDLLETKPVVETVKPAPKRPARKPVTKK